MVQSLCIYISGSLLCLSLAACGCSYQNTCRSTNDTETVGTTPEYALGGSVSGLIDGKLLKLAYSDETLSINSNGKFNFTQTIKQGSTYSVNIKQLPDNMQCVMNKPSGTAVADVIDISVSCFTPVTATGITSNQCFKSADSGLVSCADSSVISLNTEQDGNRSSINAMGFDLVTQDGITYSSNDCVKDKVTGLVWEIKSADNAARDYQKTFTHFDNLSLPQKSDGSKPSQAEIDAPDNATAYIRQVNSMKLCGITDWRLPTVRELHSIVNYGSKDIAIDTKIFSHPPNQNDEYWTSSSFLDTDGIQQAFNVNFYAGYVNTKYRDEKIYIRLVRGPILSEINRFSVVGNEVTDKQTGLIWQRCIYGQTWNGTACSGSATQFTFASALQKAAELNKQGWRLPSFKELFSLVTYGPGNTSLDAVAFPPTSIEQGFSTVSSTPSVNSNASAWGAVFDSMFISENYWAASGLYVRFVKDPK